MAPAAAYIVTKRLITEELTLLERLGELFTEYPIYGSPRLQVTLMPPEDAMVGSRNMAPVGFRP